MVFDGQRPSIELFGFGDRATPLTDRGQIVDRRGDVDMVAADRSLQDRDRLTEKSIRLVKMSERLEQAGEGRAVSRESGLLVARSAQAQLEAAADGLIDRSLIGPRAHRTRRWPPLETPAASDADVSTWGCTMQLA
jgi:hypothetical protein